MSAGAEGGAAEWARSAAAWIAAIGEEGDWSRRYVLDRPMLQRLYGRGFQAALDLGCGEGRFCRAMRREGIGTIGLDPVPALIDQARRLDPDGDYRIGVGEATGLSDRSVDLVVAYLTLIDIADLAATIGEVGRVLRPGGTFLIANLQSFNTAGEPGGWHRDDNDLWRFGFRGYLDARPVTMRWDGVAVTNWHRPLSTYMDLLLRAGFTLRTFIEPEPYGPDDAQARRYREAPFFIIMEWRAPDHP